MEIKLRLSAFRFPFSFHSLLPFVPFVLARPSLRVQRSNPDGQRDCFTGEQCELRAGLLRRFAPRNDAFDVCLAATRAQSRRENETLFPSRP
jgi:hypothetical protein